MSVDTQRAQDARAREVAQTEFGRPVVLEAGAGTGKTSALVARAVAWCLGAGWEQARLARAEAAGKPGAPEDRDAVAADTLSGVVALTFTEAAAAEMATRVGRALDALSRDEHPEGLLASALPPEPDIVRERARALGGSLDRLGVRTIHAFCRRLLVRHPLEAGLHPRFAVDASELATRTVVREVVEARLRAAHADPEGGPIVDLAEREVGPEKLEQALLALVGAGLPADALTRDPFDAATVRALVADLAEKLQAFLAAGGGTLADRKGAKKQARAARVLEALAGDLTAAASDRGAFAALCRRVSEEWKPSLEGSLRAWAEGGYSKAMLDFLGDRAESVERTAGPLLLAVRGIAALDPERFDLLRRALHPMLQEVDGLLRRRGIQTYQGLLQDARALLRDHPDVARRERERIRQLLVDEFQDTDALQCEIVASLALGGDPETRPGLFIVGDPKQSIYGWRNADLRAYEALLDRVSAAGAERLLLSVNHRSVPAILDEVARVIEPVMIREEGLQPPFAPLLPGPDLEPTAHGAAVEHWVSWRWNEGPDPDVRRRDASEIEAKAVARELAELAVRGVPWNEMALLFRASSDFDLYLDALRERGVPYAVAREKSFYQRREIIDASALVRCVLDPNDHVALLAWLRSAAVGVPDAAWIPLWSHDFPGLMSRLRGTDPSVLPALQDAIRKAAAVAPAVARGGEALRGWGDSLVEAVDALATLRAAYRRLPADRFVETLRTRTLLEVSEAARYLGAFRSANLDRFFRGLEGALEESAGDVGAVLRALRSGVADQREEDEGRPLGAALAAVQVMTVHKAKGLGFRHVFLLQTHKGSGRNESQVTRVMPQTAGVELSLLGSPSPGYAEARGHEQAREAAERVRTLYVALTRARERLVVMGDAGASDTSSYAELLRRRRERPADLSALMEQCMEDGTWRHTDANGVRWAFPAVRDHFEPDTAAEPPPPAFRPDASSHAAAVARLRARAAAAAAHAERKHQGAPSSEAHGRGLEQLAAERFPEGADVEGFAGVATSRDGALAVGTAVHAALEQWRPGADPEAEIARVWAWVAGALADHAPPAERERCEENARRLLAGFGSGTLGRRFAEIGPHLVGREVPVLLPPDAGDAVGPVGSIAGAIDLLYREPATGEWVVADFKTDRAADAGAVRALAARYAEQGAHYTRAIQAALGLAAAPRFELWLLGADTIQPA